ncbi:MAG: acetolactate synthase, small subunit [Chloroflexi bacterium]|jgi:acetolactate synthase-1/3 small subunit|nr:acetolactate synthase, small subunit [Chloroflexota bacterium]MDB5076863.1 acetolactate synthase, small subunit [Chloroflexota bacterium]
MIEYATRPVTPHTLVVLMQDHPGVLNRVSSLFRQRGFNIESLTVSNTDTPGISRMTLVVDGNTTNVEQVQKQLYKLIEVTKVTEVTHEPHVSRELALIKVSTTGNKRPEILQLIEVYKGVVVDVGADSVTAEITGPRDLIDAILGVMRPFGIKEFVRTGIIAMARGSAN